MPVDARKILPQGGRGGIADEAYVALLEKKWDPLLEGIPSRTPQEKYIRGVTAMMYENQSDWLRNLDEDTRAANVGSFTKYIFPILYNVFPNLISHEICSVQPMSAPHGAVFWRDNVYGTTKGSTTAGNTFPRDFDKDYSSEYINGETIVVGDGVNYGGAGTAMSAVLAFNPVRPLDASRGFQVTIREIRNSDGATVQEAVDKGDGTFEGDAASGTINYSNGAITNFKFTNPPTQGNQVKAFYFYDGELNSKIPQINLDVKSAPIQAESYRLKALWSPEAMEDLRAQHGQDAEQELVLATAQEIGLEIDRRNLDNIFRASTGTTGALDRTPPAGVHELEHLRSLLTVISTVSNIIHKKTMRAPANFIVTSGEVSALLSQLTTHGDYRPIWQTGLDGPVEAPRPLVRQGQFGIFKAGTLMNKWVIYEDPFFPRDMMLLGLKGLSYLEAGYIWAPYRPLEVTPTLMDPNDMSFRKGFRTRAAHKLVRPEFYGQIRVVNL